MSTKRNITINVSADLYVGFNRLCSVSGANKNEYGNALIAYAVKHDLIAGQNAEEHAAWVEAIREGKTPLPKVGIEIKAGPPQKLHVYETGGHQGLLRVAEEPEIPNATKRKRA